MTISIDELSRLAGEDYRAKDEAKRKRQEAREALRQTKAEPGRARPGHSEPAGVRGRGSRLGWYAP